MLCVSANFVFAGDVLKVKAVSSISTKYPSDIAVQVKDPATVGNLEVHQGYMLYGKMHRTRFECADYHQISSTNAPEHGTLIVYNRDETGSGVAFSPYDKKLAKESTSAGDFLKKELIKDSPLDTGWKIELKPGDSLKFNLP